MRNVVTIGLLCVLISGCTRIHTLVPAGQTNVAKKNMTVQPASAWNKVPKHRSQTANEETWTKNGSVLDSITFLAGLEDGDELAKYSHREERRIPVFRTNMTPPDYVSMVESSYRIRGGISRFEMTKLQPTAFLGADGIQMDYDYIGGDDVKRKGRTVLAVVNERLYMLSLDGTALHYFHAALADFEAIIASAAVR